MNLPTHVKLTETRFLDKTTQIAMSINKIMFEFKYNIKLNQCHAKQCYS